MLVKWTDQPIYYNDYRRREEKTIEELFDDVEEGPSNTEQPWGLYEELDLGTVRERQYNKKDSAAKDKAGKGEYSTRNDTMCTWTTSTHSVWYISVECTSTKLYSLLYV